MRDLGRSQSVEAGSILWPEKKAKLYLDSRLLGRTSRLELFSYSYSRPELLKTSMKHCEQPVSCKYKRNANANDYREESRKKKRAREDWSLDCGLDIRCSTALFLLCVPQPHFGGLARKGKKGLKILF